jgi:hypothetical protein
MPAYVDYSVCGTPVSPCLTGTWCDTVRVYYVKPVDVDITPKNTYFCNGILRPVVLTTTVTNGRAPFKYLWSNGATSPSITAMIPGPYSVSVTDSFGCNTVRDTAMLISVADPTSIINGLTNVCEEEIEMYTATPNPNYSYSWSATNGMVMGASDQDQVIVKWGVPGSGDIILNIHDNVTGCNGLVNLSVSVNSRPVTPPIQH